MHQPFKSEKERKRERKRERERERKKERKRERKKSAPGGQRNEGIMKEHQHECGITRYLSNTFTLSYIQDTKYTHEPRVSGDHTPSMKYTKIFYKYVCAIKTIEGVEVDIHTALVPSSS